VQKKEEDIELPESILFIFVTFLACPKKGARRKMTQRRAPR
jgi:hypothetical protein